MDLTAELASLTFPQTSTLNSLEIRSDFVPKMDPIRPKNAEQEADEERSSEELTKLAQKWKLTHALKKGIHLYQDPADPDGVEHVLLRIDQFLKKIHDTATVDVSDQAIFQRAYKSMQAAARAKASCVLSRAFKQFEVHPAKTPVPGNEPTTVHLDADAEKDPITDLEEQINSKEFQEEFIKLFPGEDFTAVLEYMRQACSAVRDLPNDPRFKKVLELYIDAELEKIEEWSEAMTKLFEAGNLKDIVAGAEMLKKRLLDVEWRESRALLYCLEALQEGKVLMKKFDAEKKKEAEDPFQALSKILETARETLKNCPAMLKDVKDALKDAKGLQEDRERILAERIEAQEILAAIRLKLKAMEEELNSEREVAWREFWLSGPVEVAEPPEASSKGL